MQEHIALKNYTTLRLGGRIRYFFVCKNEQDIVCAATFATTEKIPILPLGGGSNLIVSDELHDMVCLKMENIGIEIFEENSKSALVRANAGEIWDDFVAFTVLHNLSGVEALSMIPGTCGASPIQNIGAYGTEVSQTIESVRVYNLPTQQFETLSNADCQFGYRDSVFKNKLKGKCIIESVVFRLSKLQPQIPAYPLVNTTLVSVKLEFPNATLLEQIRTTIQKIRTEKLPDPKQVANVGSFFKNVFTDEKTYRKLAEKFPNMPYFLSEETYKIPTGWLIEKAGYKGYEAQTVSVYAKNALVLVNNRAEKTADLLALASEIQSVIKEKFGFDLEIEPEIVV